MERSIYPRLTSIRLGVCSQDRQARVEVSHVPGTNLVSVYVRITVTDSDAVREIMSYPSGYIMFVAWQSYMKWACFKYVGLPYL